MFDYLIDSHCHLHDREFFTAAQAEQFLQNAEDAGVRQIICIGTDPQDSLAAREFAVAHSASDSVVAHSDDNPAMRPDVYWTYGIHPEHAGRWFAESDADIRSDSSSEHADQDFASFQPQRDANLVAIGEIGLDYHYEGYNRTAQIRLFEEMLQLAQDLNLPVSLHIREAFADAWSVLDNFPKVTGVVHSFTGSKKDLREALRRGFLIGVNGLATYTTPALPPLEKMVLETDAPFLTPVPFRGTISLNQPAYVREIAAYLAQKLGVAEVNVAEQTTKNARQLFNLRDISA